ESRDESSDLDEEAALEGQQQAVPVVGTIADEPLGLGYRDLRRLAPVQTPPSPEWSSGSLPVSPSSLIVPEIEKSLALVFRAPLIDEEFEASDPSNTRTTSSHSLASSNSTAPTARMTVRAQPAMSPGLSTRVTEKTYRGTSELILDIETEDDESKTEGAGSRSKESRDESSDLDEEAALEGQQQAVLVVGTIADEPLGLGYRDLRRRELGYDRDLRELYTVSREARDEFFSQHYRLRILEQEQKRATVSFRALWRPMLALEAWAGYVDAR
nr:hypothetical protein [Tanacetum cinerariifolium]